jgi:hypothetical protein
MKSNLKNNLTSRPVKDSVSNNAFMSGLRMTFPVWAMLALSVSPAPAIQPPSQADGSAKTAGDQRNNKQDLAMTAQIRKALTADKTLSTAAHNVTIITQNGMVTLRGTVKSAEEKESIVSKARDIAGATMVNDSLSIAQPKAN